MKSWRKFLWLIPIIVASLTLYRLYCQDSEKDLLISPILDISSIASGWEKETDFPWLPNNQPDNLDVDKVDISATSALVIDYQSGKILYAKNANRPLPIASLTKVMTALIALETVPLDQKMIVSHQATQIGETTMNLEAGEKLSLEELLYGVMMVSGNDAATTIAENITGRIPLFINLMNKKASLLGLKNTKFYNPHGLDEDTNPPNQSTVYELAILTYYALDKFPQLTKIAGTDEIIIADNGDHHQYYLINNLGLERTYPGLVGLKPGFTDLAGYCLIGLAENEEKEVLVVFLGSENLKSDLVSLLDYWFIEE